MGSQRSKQDNPDPDARNRVKKLEEANRRLEREVRRLALLEDALRQGAMLYKAVVEDQAELVCRFTPDCVLTFVNPAYCRFFGQSEDQLLGRSFLPLVPEEHHPAVFDNIRAITRDSPLRFTENAVLAADGDVRWVRWSNRGFFDAAGGIVEYQAVGSDLTGRHRAEEELARLNAELEQRVAERTRVAEDKAARLAQEAAQRKQAEQGLEKACRLAAVRSRVASVFLTVQGDEIFSAGLRLLLDATNSEYGVFAYFDEEGAMVAPSLSRDVWDRCQVPEKTIRFPRETWGDTIWARAILERRMLVRNVPVSTPEGHVPIRSILVAPILYAGRTVGVLFLANRPGGYGGDEQEIVDDARQYVAPLLHAWLERERLESERRRSEEALRQSEELFRHLFERHTAVKLLIDPDSGAILDANLAAVGFYGWSREQLRSMRIHDINTLPPEAVKEEMAKVRARERVYFEFRHRRADGSIRDVAVFSSRFEMKGKAFLHSIIHDITERKQALEALRRSEERYRTLFETAPVGIFRSTPEGRYLAVNPAHAEMLGYASAEEFTAGVSDIAGQVYADPARRTEFLRLLRAHGQVKEFESLRRTRDGADIWLSTCARLVTDPDAGQEIIEGFSRDITHRKQAEDALRRRLELEQVLAGVSGQLIGLRLEELEKDLRPLLGIVAEAIGADAARVCSLDAGGAACLASWSAEGESQAEGVCARDEGAHSWVMSRLRSPESLVIRRIGDLPPEAAAVRASLDKRGVLSLLAVPLSKAGASVGCLTFTAVREPRDWNPEDVTLIETFARVLGNAIESARLERTLRYNERRYFDLIDGLSEGLWVVDRQGKTTFINRSMAGMLGYEPGEMLGADPRDYMSEEKAHHLGQALEESRQGISHRHSMEFVHRDGRRVFVDISGSPVRDEQGAIVGSMALARDMTRERLLQLQLVQAQRLEAIGQLAAGIAHEINTPTQYVENNPQFLRGAFDDLLDVLREYDALLAAARDVPALAAAVRRVEEAREERKTEHVLADVPGAFEDADDGLRRISVIVDSVKRFAHPGQAGMAPADLNVALRGTIVVARNEWKYVADLAAELDPDLPPVPCVLPDINQVALNLIVNAAHAIAADPGRRPDEKGLITVRTRVEDGWAVIEVQDTGTGIPVDVRSRIFDPFFTTKEVGRGTGQGLAIARTVVADKHHGAITFETEEGKGTTFSVRLPLEQPQEKPEP
ncbi:MAG: PAS domain S-box protein [Thermodesulfobacteriota bacterium]